MKCVRTCAASLLILSATSCAPAVVSDDCSWVQELTLSDPAIDAMDRSDLEQVVAHNRLVREFCR